MALKFVVGGDRALSFEHMNTAIVEISARERGSYVL